MVPKDRMLQRLDTYDLLGCPKGSPAGEAAMLPGLYRSSPPPCYNVVRGLDTEAISRVNVRFYHG